MSTKYFVDTNIFVYTLFTIDDQKYSACKKLFKKAEAGDIQLWTTEWVIAELIWFLRRRDVSQEKIKDIVLTIIVSKGLEVQNKSQLMSVINSWEEGIDFLDVYNLHCARQLEINRGYTYDRDFDKVDNFTRLEP